MKGNVRIYIIVSTDEQILERQNYLIEEENDKATI